MSSIVKTTLIITFIAIGMITSVTLSSLNEADAKFCNPHGCKGTKGYYTIKGHHHCWKGTKGCVKTGHYKEKKVCKVDSKTKKKVCKEVEVKDKKKKH